MGLGLREDVISGAAVATPIGKDQRRDATDISRQPIAGALKTETRHTGGLLKDRVARDVTSVPWLSYEPPTIIYDRPAHHHHPSVESFVF